MLFSSVSADALRCKHVKVSPYLIKHHAVKTAKWVKVKLHAILASALDVRESSASRSGRLTPVKHSQVLNGKEAGLVPELVWTPLLRENFATLHEVKLQFSKP